MKRNKVELKLQREIAVKDGFYDGRFSIKIVGNKKAIYNKLIARKKVVLNFV